MSVDIPDIIRFNHENLENNRISGLFRIANRLEFDVSDNISLRDNQISYGVYKLNSSIKKIISNNEYLSINKGRGGHITGWHSLSDYSSKMDCLGVALQQTTCPISTWDSSRERFLILIFIGDATRYYNITIEQISQEENNLESTITIPEDRSTIKIANLGALMPGPNKNMSEINLVGNANIPCIIIDYNSLSNDNQKNFPIFKYENDNSILKWINNNKYIIYTHFINNRFSIDFYTLKYNIILLNLYRKYKKFIDYGNWTTLYKNRLIFLVKVGRKKKEAIDEFETLLKNSVKKNELRALRDKLEKEQFEFILIERKRNLKYLSVLKILRVLKNLKESGLKIPPIIFNIISETEFKDGIIHFEAIRIFFLKQMEHYIKNHIDYMVEYRENFDETKYREIFKNLERFKINISSTDLKKSINNLYYLKYLKYKKKYLKLKNQLNQN